MENKQKKQKLPDILAAFLEEDKKQAFQHIKQKAEVHDASALYLMGLFYEGGYGVVTISKSRAKQYYDLAAQAGKPIAALQKLERAAKTDPVLFKKAEALAHQGYYHAQDYIGCCYAKGLYTAQSDSRAIHWFRQGAAQGYAVAQTHLGDMYIRSTGDCFCDDDSEETRNKKINARQLALRQYHKAAAQEYAVAQQDIGWELLLGDDSLNPEGLTAVTWYQKAARQGLLEAQEGLGVMLADWKGLDLPQEQALGWRKAAAFQGSALAQWVFGEDYEYGDGVPQSYQMAAFWYHKAALQGAEQGSEYAQYRLGLLYHRGLGVPQSDGKALYWLNKAAAQGVEEALDYVNDNFR